MPPRAKDKYAATGEGWYMVKTDSIPQDHSGSWLEVSTWNVDKLELLVELNRQELVKNYEI